MKNEIQNNILYNYKVISKSSGSLKFTDDAKNCKDDEFKERSLENNL